MDFIEVYSRDFTANDMKAIEKQTDGFIDEIMPEVVSEILKQKRKEVN